MMAKHFQRAAGPICSDPGTLAWVSCWLLAAVADSFFLVFQFGTAVSCSLFLVAVLTAD